MTLTHDELKAVFWNTAAPEELRMPTADEIISAVHGCLEPNSATESDVVLCQNCKEPFMPTGDEWFCPVCVANVPEWELDIKRRNIAYYLRHGGGQ